MASFCRSLLRMRMRPKRLFGTVFAMTSLIALDRKTDSQGLDPSGFKPYQVSSIEHYNHNSKVYTIKVPGQGSLPVSSFVLTKAPIDTDGKDVVRPYTPISPADQDQIRLLIKSYPDGKMSKHFDRLKPGDSIELKGPMKKLEYTSNMKKEIGMIAGGTGITPCLQVIEQILKNPNDKTKITLLYSGTTEADLLMREELQFLTTFHENFHVYYTVSKPKPNWRGEVGHVTKELISSLMPKPEKGEDVLVYVCGPPPFYKTVSGGKNPKDLSQGELSGYLKELGFNEKQVFKF